MATPDTPPHTSEAVLLDADRGHGRSRALRTSVRLLGYLRPYTGRLALTAISMLAYTLTLVTIPWTIRLMIDGYIATPRSDFGGLYRLLALFGSIVLVHYVSDLVFNRNLVVLGHRVLYALRVLLFQHMMRLSMRFYDRNQIGRVMSRVQNDVQQLQELLNIAAFTVAHAAGLSGVIAAMLIMSWRLALITLASVGLVVPVLIFWQRYASASFLRTRESIADVNAGLQENLSAVRVIQSLNRQKANMRLFHEVNRKNLGANLQATRYIAALWPSVDAISSVGLALVVLFGGTMVLRGSFEVGVLVAFALYLQRFYEPMERLIRDYGQIQQAAVSVARTFEVLDIEPAPVNKPDAVELDHVRGEVRYEGVDFAYDPQTRVLQDIDLTIQPGETVALVGPTGAGKTTLVSLLLRFYDVSAGRITIDGHDVRDVSIESLSRQVSVVLQEPYLFSGTVRENIRYNSAHATDQDIERAARAVGAHQFVTELDHGYETVLHERGGNLSVGQRQLLSFARALAANPRVLVLDEATANIDTYTEMVIQNALSELLAGRTAIVIAHRLSTVRSADRIVVVEEGRIVEQGAHDELMALDDRYARLVSATLEGRQ